MGAPEAVEAQRAGERNLGIIVGDRGADPLIGGGETAFSGGDIRAPAQDINGPGLVTNRRECRDGGDDQEFIGVAAGLRAHQHVEAIDLCVERNF